MDWDILYVLPHSFVFRIFWCIWKGCLDETNFFIYFSVINAFKGFPKFWFVCQFHSQTLIRHKTVCFKPRFSYLFKLSWKMISRNVTSISYRMSYYNFLYVISETYSITVIISRIIKSCIKVWNEIVVDNIHSFC